MLRIQRDRPALCWLARRNHHIKKAANYRAIAPRCFAVATLSAWIPMQAIAMALAPAEDISNIIALYDRGESLLLEVDTGDKEAKHLFKEQESELNPGQLPEALATAKSAAQGPETARRTTRCWYWSAGASDSALQVHLWCS